MYTPVKRLLDLAVAASLLVVLLPLLLLVALVLRFTGEGEILYLQERVGHRNENFVIWKFATMLKDSPNLGQRDITVRNDPRILPLGGVLRKTKFNEIPQLVNVLKGEMSLVGPRPLMRRSFDRYSKEAQGRLYEIKPGITSIASILFRDEEALASAAADIEATYVEIAECKAVLEGWYREHISLRTDLSILALTACALACSPQTAIDLVYRVFPGLPKDELFGLRGSK